MIKKILIFLILLSSAYFFNVIFLPTPVISLIQFGITGILFAFILFQELYVRTETIKHNFKYPIFLIFSGVFLSMIIAQSYHNQSYVLTFWAQRFMYFYLFYFFLHIIKPDIKDLEKILLALGILYVVSYLVQYLIYPIAIFDVRQDADRGTIRIFLPGASFLAISLFLCLQRFYIQNKLQYIFFVLIFFSILVLMGTRNFLVAVVLVILFSLIFSKIIRSRYIIYFIILISTVPLYLLFQDIFAGLIELSVKDRISFQSDIRVRAVEFFLTDFFPNKLAYFFGNGHDHGRSIYGLRVAAYMRYRGFYQSDIGIIGDFSKFGIFYVLGYLWLLLKAFKTRIKPEYFYIKYYILLSSLTLPFGGTSSNSIAVICILIYIIDKNIDDLKEESVGREYNSLDQAHSQADVVK